MPTESTFFFAGLLFIAAALGYVFARFGDLDDEDEERELARANFLKGFRHLLNEEPDRAVEAFTTGTETDAEAVDTQVALGGLFRRRGELERAIRLHQNLLDRPGLDPAAREQAMFALAEDFLGAGLFDRAEELLLRLRDSRYHRKPALDRLLRICEVTREWGRAIDLCADLRRVDASAIETRQVGHYHCELAEQARKAGDTAAARDDCDRADAEHPGLPRAALIAADLAADAGDGNAAVRAYWQVLAADPALVGEVLPRLAKVGALASGPEARNHLEAIAREGPESLRRVVAALAVLPGVDAAMLAPFLARYVESDPVLGLLGDAAVLADGNPVLQANATDRLRRAVVAALRGSPRYRCGNCGYHSASLQWQCPGCRRWDTIRGTDVILPVPTVSPSG